MSAVDIGKLVGWHKKAQPRIASKARRGSYDENDRRARIFAPICDGRTADALRWRDKLIQTAREYDRHEKAPGDREGPLGYHGVWVLEVMLHLVDFGTGRCDPSLDTICRRAKLARATVVRAIKQLCEHGFLHKVRRTRLTGNAPSEGPQREQISNAYAFARDLKERVRQRFRQLFGGKKLAEEIRAAKRREAEAREAVLAAPLSARGAMLHPQDPAMAALLDRLGASLDKGQVSAPQSASSVTGEYPS